MEFSSYMEVNIIIDLFLICVFSIVVLPRSPRFYVLFLLLNLSQYAFVVPMDPEQGEARLVWSEEPDNEQGATRNNDSTERTSSSRAFPGPAQTPIDLIGRASQGFAAVTGAMGGETSAVNDSAMREKTGFSSPSQADGSSSRSVSLNPGEIMVDALRDPEAMWLGMRFFWLAACFMLFIQRPGIGAAAACANLLPVPFLARVIPYAHHQIQSNQTIHDVDASLSDPETVAEWTRAFWTSNGFLVLVLTAVALAILAFFIILRERRNARDTEILRDQLDPERFWIDLNGGFHDFSVDDHELVVGDLRFPLNRVSRVANKEGFWKLGGRSIVRFVSKNAPADSAPRFPASYSYKRKK